MSLFLVHNMNVINIIRCHCFLLSVGTVARQQLAMQISESQDCSQTCVIWGRFNNILDIWIAANSSFMAKKILRHITQALIIMSGAVRSLWTVCPQQPLCPKDNLTVISSTVNMHTCAHCAVNSPLLIMKYSIFKLTIWPESVSKHTHLLFHYLSPEETQRKHEIMFLLRATVIYSRRKSIVHHCKKYLIPNQLLQ